MRKEQIQIQVMPLKLQSTVIVIYQLLKIKIRYHEFISTPKEIHK